MVEFASSDSHKRESNGFLVTLSAIMALLAKRASRLRLKSSSSATKSIDDDGWRIDLRSPKPWPKKLLSKKKLLSSKALFGCGKKKESDGGEGWGNGGVWQREILMGGKCEPLDYSGVIYYDVNGKQTNELPLRSPRASPMPGYLTRNRHQ